MVLMLRVVKSEVTATVSDMANSKKAQTQSLKTPAEVQSSIATLQLLLLPNNEYLNFLLDF